MSFGERGGTRSSRSKARSEDQRGTKEAKPPLTRQKLEELALSYLNRFDCSGSKLKSQLTARVRKLGGPPEAFGWIDELLQRYRSSGLVDDARFAKNLASQLGARGKSSRAIAQKLAQRGVPGEVASELMSERKQSEPGAELSAALAYVRKRRLGPYRSAEKREEYRHKDLASLARQGFSFDIAKKALGDGAASDEEF